MKTIALTIDGKSVTCPPETSILHAAEENNIYIPTLCNYHELKPHGACRICIVEDKTSNRLLASCVTPVSDQMEIQTASARVIEQRRNIVRLMMAEHPDSCLVCTKSNRCELRKIATELDIGESNLYPMHNYTPLDQSTPFIFRDMTKCILCGKCIRACKELVVNGTIDYSLRGFKSRPSTAGRLPLNDSDCLFCGTCASICPTGAITQSNSIYSGTAERYHESICGFCGAGCSITFGINDNRIIEVSPSMKKDSVNGITLCVRGHFALDYLDTPKRIKNPIMRENGEIFFPSWQEVIDSIVGRLLEIKEKYGADAIGFYGSSKCTNEENYLFQKIARTVIETGNIDNGGFLYGRNLMQLIDQRTGVTCRVNKFEDLKYADVIFVVGADPGESVPVLNYHIKRAVKKGTVLIVMDHNNTDLATLADIWLKPVSELNFTEHCSILANCISACLFKRQDDELHFVDWFTKNFDDFGKELSDLNITKGLRQTGVSSELIGKTISLVVGKKVSFVIGDDILEQEGGETAINSMINLSLMSGCFGSQGCGFYVLSKENNLVGSWDMGTVPDMLPGRELSNSNEVRKKFESVWDRGAIAQSGLDITGMIQAAENGTLKALYVMGENPLRSLPQSERIKKAFQKLELIVVQDIIENETTDIADIILPGAPFCEKSGSFTNMEGRIQTFTEAVPPCGNAKSDFEILTMLAAKLGIRKFTIEQIRNEISELVPLYKEFTNHTDTAWIQRELHGDDNDEAHKKILFSLLEKTEDKEPDKEYPFTAVLTSLHFQAGSGTRTSMSKLINKSIHKGEVELSEKTGESFGVEEGNSIRIISRYGTIQRTIRFNPSVGEEMVFVPCAYNHNDVMNLLPLTDLETGCFAGFKKCQIRVEKV